MITYLHGGVASLHSGVAFPATGLFIDQATVLQLAGAMCLTKVPTGYTAERWRPP
jgi:hypothetical protein